MGLLVLMKILVCYWLVAMVDRFVVGDWLDPEVTMGPLNNEAQLKIVRDLVADARKNGAKEQE